MKLAIASLLVGSAAAFAPAASFGVRNTALNMATETAEKVRFLLRVRAMRSRNQHVTSHNYLR